MPGFVGARVGNERRVFPLTPCGCLASSVETDPKPRPSGVRVGPTAVPWRLAGLVCDRPIGMNGFPVFQKSVLYGIPFQTEPGPRRIAPGSFPAFFLFYEATLDILRRLR